ncbi:MAG: ribosome recycling factor [Clostridia bacterium]
MENPAIQPMAEKMEKRIHTLHDDLASIRAGRANPHVLDKLQVEYYGVLTPLAQVASIQIPEARMIVIQPWDATLLKEVEKAIQKSDLGINPSNDGKCIRLAFPPLTEERRKELTKTVKKYGEEAKISVRAYRRDVIDVFKEQKKKSEITEDDLKDLEKDVNHYTEKKCEEIDRIVDAKDKEILEV